jgi:hypothetical protein
MEDAKAKLGEALLPAMTAVTGFMADTLIPGMMAAGEAIGTFVSWLVDKLGPAFSTVVGYVQPVVETLIALWQRFGDVVLAQITTVWNLIKGVFQGALQIIQGIFEVFAGLFTGNWSKMWDGIKKIFSGVIGIITSYFSYLWNTVKNIATAAWRILSDTIGKGVSAVVQFIAGLPGKAARALASLGSTLWNIAQSAMSAMGRAIGDGISNIVSAVSRLPGQIWRAIGNLYDTAWHIGADFVRGIGHGISSLLGWLVNQARNVAMAPVNARQERPAHRVTVEGHGGFGPRHHEGVLARHGQGRPCRRRRGRLPSGLRRRRPPHRHLEQRCRWAGGGRWGHHGERHRHPPLQSGGGRSGRRRCHLGVRADERHEVAGGVTSWQDVIELSVDIQMAIPPGAALWGTDKWGTAKWSKVGSGWTPVNCTDLVSLTFGLTRSSLADNYGAGQLTLNVRNAGGWVTGNPGAGQLVIRPGLPMRVRVRPTAGTWTTVWTGEVDSVTTRWDTDGTCTSTLIGADTLAMLAVIDPPETPVPSETLQARLSRLAGLTGRAGLSFLQVGAPGSGSLVAGTLAQQLVSEAMLAVNSYGGIIVASPSRPKIILWVNSEMNVFQTSARLVVTNRPQQGGAIRVCPLTFESDGPRRLRSRQPGHHGTRRRRRPDRAGHRVHRPVRGPHLGSHRPAPRAGQHRPGPRQAASRLLVDAPPRLHGHLPRPRLVPHRRPPVAVPSGTGAPTPVTRTRGRRSPASPTSGTACRCRSPGTAAPTPPTPAAAGPSTCSGTPSASATPSPPTRG